jgi:magnesium-protoporphyrin O-methyltransferase
MSCCCLPDDDTGRFFSRFARRYRRRYLRKGFETSQKQLLEGLRVAGVRDASLLEIGCGVGALHQSLLTEGARSALGIDLSERMIDEARSLAGARGLSARTAYRVANFVDVADSMESADVTILDKVICCYPDADALVERSLDRTRRVYAYTIPRDRWFVRAVLEVGALVLRLFGSRFRSYVHDPVHIEACVEQGGFHRCYQNQTAIWQTRVFVRA